MTDELIERIQTNLTYEDFLMNFAAKKFIALGGRTPYVHGKKVGDLSPDKNFHVACSTGKTHPTKGIFILKDGTEVGVPQRTLDLYKKNEKRPPRNQGSSCTW